MSEPGEEPRAGIDPTERVESLLRDLRSTRSGLSAREAARRLIHYGPNELRRRGGRRWPGELLRQFTHPLALLLWVAAVLAWVAQIVAVAVAILVMIVINAVFAFVQEVQAERAVEALAAYLPQKARVVRDGRVQLLPAAELVPGDILLIAEGDRISADARLIEGGVEVDPSTLTGEAMPVFRSAELTDSKVELLRARNLVFSGTSCTEGEAQAVVFATGMRTELGRIAALSERVEREESPLESQVRRVAWLIAAIAVVSGIAFVPLAMIGAHLPLGDAVVFAVGLLVGNVPEGLLPVITLALALGVRGLVRRGAVVKRLSAVESLGATSVICTDKTGTLTENRMRVTTVWTAAGAYDLTGGGAPNIAGDPAISEMAAVMAACNNAQPGVEGELVGDPTEVAMLEAAITLGEARDTAQRRRRRLRQFHFDPVLKLMSTLDERDADMCVDTKGAPEAVLPRCTTILESDRTRAPITPARRHDVERLVDSYARQGLRVLAVAARRLPGRGGRSGVAVPPPAAPTAVGGHDLPERREQAERELTLLGLVAMHDPPRPGVADAVRHCRTAGIRIIVVTGDHALTAAAIAAQVGIVGAHPTVVTGDRLARMSEDELDALLRRNRQLIFARSSPEAKLRIADALRAEGHVVAMTGDGVNDAPALRRADIGVAMGRSGTDVAREASTMVLTDDNFATVVAAVRTGRQVYDNIRKFICYIFAHTTPEVTPFLVFALAGGTVPLPLTVLQLLAFEVGTETLPALALGREPAEPGLMRRPPRARSESVVRLPMLLRAWLFLGVICAVLSMAGFFYVLLRAGWYPGAPTGPGTRLHHAYRQATTMTFLGMIAGQVGTAFAVRTERASLRSIGVVSNPLLLWGIAFELALAAIFIYASPFQALLGTASLTWDMLAFVVPFPLIVWGADEIRRYVRRRDGRTSPNEPGARSATVVRGELRTREK
ncbi:cation-translocating P-type ATPase [Sphaerisporangium dianthi]|uniref:Cation-translocating P-type ATPase n=1 Tax=Sphaerisporangium dianthi TaxID=1436120 RepID=A0ABV9CJF6_9ACTN